jgi:hypothetical protein
MKGKEKSRHQKSNSPYIGNFIHRYFEDRTCRRMKEIDFVETDPILSAKRRADTLSSIQAQQDAELLKSAGTDTAQAEAIRLLVTGGRDYNNQEELYRVLDQIASEQHIDVIIHGAARGADTLASYWAEDRGVETIAVPADWNRYGRAAGSVRNQKMLDDHHPHLVVAFKGGSGTKNMIGLAEKAGIEVIRI